MTGALPTREQLDILLHSLGLVAPYYGEPYRSYFCTYGNDAKLLALVEAGWMTGPHRRSILPEGEAYFYVTDIGRAVALPHRPRQTRAQARYSKWLEISDVQPDLTFGDFLRGVQP